MRKCDWHGEVHGTSPAVLGDSRTGEIRDADLCAEARNRIRTNLLAGKLGRTAIYRYGHPGPEGHFQFDMVEW